AAARSETPCGATAGAVTARALRAVAGTTSPDAGDSCPGACRHAGGSPSPHRAGPRRPRSTPDRIRQGSAGASCPAAVTELRWGRHSCLPCCEGRQECLPHQPHIKPAAVRTFVVVALSSFSRSQPTFDLVPAARGLL